MSSLAFWFVTRYSDQEKHTWIWSSTALWISHLLLVQSTVTPKMLVCSAAIVGEVFPKTSLVRRTHITCVLLDAQASFLYLSFPVCNTEVLWGASNGWLITTFLAQGQHLLSVNYHFGISFCHVLALLSVQHHSFKHSGKLHLTLKHIFLLSSSVRIIRNINKLPAVPKWCCSFLLK